ncbi:MAG: SigE family polymerase sigma factor [Ilumatobacteraceae bacterium]|nr:SigE family polymerase sigma factor [Ilumatobacteraceae bacterium]
MADPEVASAGAAFAAVYTAEHDPLVRLAALVTGSTIVAEDLVQEAFAKLHPRFARIDNPPAWLRTVVLNGARNELRRAGLRRRLVERTPRAAGTHVDAPVNELIDSLRRLPARQRAVVVLRYYEDRPEAEIAELLGMRLGTVKSSLHRAHTALRQELSHD